MYLIKMLVQTLLLRKKYSSFFILYIMLNIMFIIFEDTNIKTIHFFLFTAYFNINCIGTYFRLLMA